MALLARTPAKPQIETREIAPGVSDVPGSIAKLAQLHAEAEETARLANLLGRTLYAAIALPVLAVLAIGFADGVSLTPQLVWCALVAAGSVAMLRVYTHTIGQSFQRPALKSFAETLSPMLLYAGFAWGAGAFLALPTSADPIAAMAFVAVPSIAIAALLREREAVFLFLAPTGLLASFASVLRPFADGALSAGLIVILCAAIAGGVVFAARRRASEFVRPAMLPSR